MAAAIDLDLHGCITGASFRLPDRVVPPYGWVEHIAFAFWLVDVLHPRQVVELGTAGGNSFFAFCQAAAASEPSARLTAIDTWQGDLHTGGYDNSIYEAVSRYRDATFPQTATLLRTTFAEARTGFAPGTVDLLHIDGLHTYEAVREDFETWRDTLSERGVVLFHDIAVREHGFGVWRLWAELAPRYPSFAFNHGNGLGVLAIGPAVPEAVLRLCGLPEATADTLRLIYHRLGRSVIDWERQLNQTQRELDGSRISRSWKIAAALSRLEDTVRGRKPG